MTDQLSTKWQDLVDPNPDAAKVFNDCLNSCVLLEPFDLINQLYERVGIRAATEALLKTPEVALLLELSQDEQMQKLLGSRLLYEARLASNYPAFTRFSPFEFSISSYVAVLLTVQNNWSNFVAACLMITNGLNLPHKILEEYGQKT
jgi:hypothetical protein